MKYKAKRRMFALLCLVVIMASLTCTALAANVDYKVYTSSGVGANLRKSCSVTAAIVATLSDGTTVHKQTSSSYDGDSYTWYYVQVTSGTNTGKFGYIVVDYLVPA